MMTTARYSLLLCYVLRPDLLFQAAAVLENFGGVYLARESGGLRVIYYWDKAEERIYMLLVYPKAHQEDLTQEQLTALRKFVKENLK